MIGNKDIANEQFLLKITLWIITAIQHVIVGLKWDLSQTSYIRRTKCFSYRLTVGSIHCSHVLSRSWRYRWSSGDRRYSNYIWMINNWLPSKVRLIFEVGSLYYDTSHSIYLFLAFIDAFCAGCASATECSWISLKWNEIPGFRPLLYLTIRWVNMFLKIKKKISLITTFLRFIFHLLCNRVNLFQVVPPCARDGRKHFDDRRSCCNIGYP